MRKALYGYKLADKSYVNNNVDDKRFKNWPPLAVPKYIDEIIEIEIIDHFIDKNRCYLYAKWSDGIKYLSDWNESALKRFLGDKFAEKFKGKRKTYSEKLSKALLKDAKLNI